MPIYEYRCGGCGRRSSVFFRSLAEADAGPSCSRCGSSDMRKLISRFAPLKSEDEMFESLADPSRFGEVDENDPKSVAQWARRMGREMGEETGPEFNEAIDEMEAGIDSGDGEPEGAGVGVGEAGGDDDLDL